MHSRDAASLVALPSLCGVLVAGCRVGPELQAPGAAPPAAYPGRRRAAEARVAGRRALVAGVRRRGAAGAAPRRDRQQPRSARWPSRGSGGARAAGVAKSFLYPDINLDGRVHGQPGVEELAAAGRARTTAIAPSTTPRSTSTLSWEIDLFGRLRREQRSRVHRYLASEQGRRAVLVTLVGDVATTYFLLRELDLQLEIARQTLRLNDQTVDLLHGPARRRRVEPARARSRRRPTAR